RIVQLESGIVIFPQGSGFLPQLAGGVARRAEGARLSPPACWGSGPGGGGGADFSPSLLGEYRRSRGGGRFFGRKPLARFARAPSRPSAVLPLAPAARPLPPACGRRCLPPLRSCFVGDWAGAPRV